MITSLLTRPVTVTTVTPGAPDDYGNPTQETSTVEVRGRLSQQTTVENVDGRDVTITQTRLFLLPDVTITSTSRVTVGDRTFDVDGQPNVVYAATNPHHLEVPLKETTA